MPGGDGTGPYGSGLLRVGLPKPFIWPGFRAKAVRRRRPGLLCIIAMVMLALYALCSLKLSDNKGGE